MRMGHYLTQWGPEAIQLTEGVIRGTDGQMYKSRALPPNEVSGPQEAGDQQQPEEVVEPRTSASSARGGVRMRSFECLLVLFFMECFYFTRRHGSLSDGQLLVHRSPETRPLVSVSR